MYEYGCEVDRVVDGDTIDVTLDLGFDILFKSRVGYMVLILLNLELEIKMKKLEAS